MKLQCLEKTADIYCQQLNFTLRNGTARICCTLKSAQGKTELCTNQLPLLARSQLFN